MNTPRSLSVWIVLPLFAVCASAAGGQELRPGRLSQEERAALRQGVVVTFKSIPSAEGDAPAVDTRRSRLAALHVPAGTPPSPFLAAGPFEATLAGYVKMKLRGEYLFSMQGRGTASLSLNGQTVMRSAADGDLSQVTPVSVELIKGYNRLVLSYNSPAQGDATLRLYWRGEEFPTEPLPPADLMHDGRIQPLAEAESRRHGRQLFATRNCGACHAATVKIDDPDTAMPELARTAPALDGVGSRLRQAWIARWIIAPSDARQRTTMPRVLAGLDEKTASGQASDIAAYLATLKLAEPPPVAAADPKAVKQGEILFEDRGCIACHLAASSDVEQDDYDRISLAHVAQKFQPGALAAFLREPHKYYPWTRMPGVRLDQPSAAALAAFLEQGAKKPLPAPTSGDAERGRQRFATAGCANCHRVDDGPLLRPHLPAIAFAASSPAAKGCLSDDQKLRGQAPDFKFTESQRAELRAFLGTDRSSLARRVPSEFSLRQVERLRCTACHQRDDRQSDLPYVLQDESLQGGAPENMPALTYAGEKLNPPWTAALLAGRLGYRPRPHLKVHMPAFPVRAELLSRGLSHEHGFAADYAAGPPPDAEMAKVGHALSLQQGGFNCVQCHGVGDRQAQAPFDERSTNLSYARDRLRYDYFRRWLLFPQRIAPSTKMPRFSPAGRKTGLAQYYDGDAEKQFDALWHYLHTLRRKKLAVKVE